MQSSEDEMKMTGRERSGVKLLFTDTLKLLASLVSLIGFAALCVGWVLAILVRELAVLAWRKVNCELEKLP